MMETKYGAIFDCDGVLMKTMDGWIQLGYAAQDVLKIEFTQQDIQFLMTTSIPEACEYIAEHYGDAIPYSEAEIKSMAQAKMLNFYQTSATPKEGVAEYLKMLHEAGVPAYIATSSNIECVQAGLERCGIADYITGIYSVEEEQTSKREPSLYLKTAEAMGTLPENTWVFEDSYYAITTAHAAGFKCVGVDDGGVMGAYDQLATVADVMIHEFTDIAGQFPPAL